MLLLVLHLRCVAPCCSAHIALVSPGVSIAVGAALLDVGAAEDAVFGIGDIVVAALGVGAAVDVTSRHPTWTGQIFLTRR